MTDSEKIIKYERIITRMNDALTSDIILEVHTHLSHTEDGIQEIVEDTNLRCRFMHAALRVKDAAKEIESEEK